VCTATQNQSMTGTSTSDVVCVEKPGFLGGPCVTSTGGTAVEIFGRGDDKKIYRRVIDGNALGSWAILGALDGTPSTAAPISTARGHCRQHSHRGGRKQSHGGRC